MDQITLIVIIVIIVIALVVVAVGVWMYMQKRRTEQVRERFGPEYDRAVTEHGDQRGAQAELEARQKRVEQLDIRPLSPSDRARFADAWRATQAHFVDDPSAAIGEADRLVTDVMKARGYPIGDFEQRAADVSVDHPRLVENYRGARDTALRNERGQASTEDLRQAMVHYRALFEDLLETGTSEQTQVRRTEGGQ
jgi:hypothetical protein